MGVDNAAVQLGYAYEAEVTALALAANLGFISQLGPPGVSTTVPSGPRSWAGSTPSRTSRAPACRASGGY
ncbi:hypothetical protein [Amycolatopsis sp. NPDC049159]|uniref:hypothetical protein n=1 Tax=Amycolatopsis sp. NPDC049159 TaxID=3157210 RepID=UPI0033C24861